MNDIVMISGGFDPLHSGHIALIEDASKYGQIIVLLNSDKWLIKKKGKFFLPFNERSIIMNSLKNVIDVMGFNDDDTTAINGIQKVIEKYPEYKLKFANGGDRNIKTTPEKNFCNNHKIENLWEIGGNFKKNSSSEILKKWNN